VKIKLRDSHSIQILRRLSEKDIKERITRALNQNENTIALANHVTAAKQLKSGDIIVHTSSAEAAEKLKGRKEWVATLGSKAEVMIQTYGVLVHGAPIN